jgi:hypothetical protein
MTRVKVDKSDMDIIAYTVSHTGYVSLYGDVCEKGKPLKFTREAALFRKPQYEKFKQSFGVILELCDTKGFSWVFFRKGNELGLLHTIALSNKLQASIINSNLKSIIKATNDV